MATDALREVRETARALTRAYREALWTAESGPAEDAAPSLAPLKRRSIGAARAYLSAVTGWPEQQIDYDPLLDRVVVPFQVDARPPFFPGELQFGQRALLKDASFWSDKLVPADLLPGAETPGARPGDGGPGYMSKFLMGAVGGSVAAGSFLIADQALASSAASSAAFLPIGYDDSVTLVDELVYVAPRGVPGQVGRMSFSDVLAVAEEKRRAKWSLFAPAAESGAAPAKHIPPAAYVPPPSVPGPKPLTPPPPAGTKQPQKFAAEPWSSPPVVPAPAVPAMAPRAAAPAPAMADTGSTLVARLRRSAPFAASPALFELEREPRNVYWLEAPGVAPRKTTPAVGVQEVLPLPLRRIEISAFAPPELIHATAPPLYVTGLAPRAVLVTRTHIGGEPPPQIAAIAATRAPQTASRQPQAAGPISRPRQAIAAVTATTIPPALGSLILRAARRQTLPVAELRMAVRHPMFAALGEVYWRGAAQAQSELRSETLAARQARSWRLSLVRALRRATSMVLMTREQVVRRIFPGVPMEVAAPRLREVLEPGPVDRGEGFRRDSLDEFLERLEAREPKGRPDGDPALDGKPPRPWSPQPAADFVVIRPIGQVRSQSGQPTQDFKVVETPRERTLFRTAEIRLTAPADGGAVASGVRATSKRRLAEVISEYVRVVVKNQRFMRTQTGMAVDGAPTGARMLGAEAGPGRSAPPSGQAPASIGVVVEPALRLVERVIERGGTPAFRVDGHAPIPARAMTNGAAVPAGGPRKEKPSDGLIFDRVLDLSDDRFVAIMVPGKPADGVAPGAKRPPGWSRAVDRLLQVSAPPVERFVPSFTPKFLAVKDSQPAPYWVYPPIAPHAEPPVRRPARPRSAAIAPAGAPATEVKKISSDPVMEFDEGVLDELMFALNRRMTTEDEGLGGYG